VREFDEAVYRALLTSPDATPDELAEQVGCALEPVVAGLDRLRGLGLVNRLSGGQRRYTPIEPDIAVGALVRARARDLDEARATAAGLSALFHAARRASGDDAVEIVSGKEAAGHWFVRLQQQARHEVLALDRPPYMLAAANPVEPTCLARGVSWRGIYAPESLQLPGALDEVRGHIQRGEQARVLTGLPIKLAVADREIALIPLRLDMDDPQFAVVHTSTLLLALIDLFEAYWQRAIPLDVIAGGEPVTLVASGEPAAVLAGGEPAAVVAGGEPAAVDAGGPAAPVGVEDRALLTLLVSGLKDDAIARQLGLSTRTMRRRMQALLTALGVANRFQAGVQAARRGWI
jgi:predicted transcriptional regulator